MWKESQHSKVNRERNSPSARENLGVGVSFYCIYNFSLSLFGNENLFFLKSIHF